jgi:AcrR family transcriptional regulator
LIHSVPGSKNIKKKKKIIEAACRLFAGQGYEATTTVQIVKEAGATEPLLYYHFKDKEDLFTSILVSAFDRVFKKLDSLGDEASTSFGRIEKLISIHFEIVEEMPYEIVLAINTCPAKLKDPDHVCSENVKRWRGRIKSYLTDCLTGGINSGEFIDVPVQETGNMLIALINGLIRQQIHKMDNLDGVKNAAVEFCRRSLLEH